MCRLLWVNMVELSWVTILSFYGQQQRDRAIAAAMQDAALPPAQVLSPALCPSSHPRPSIALISHVHIRVRTVSHYESQFTSAPIHSRNQPGSHTRPLCVPLSVPVHIRVHACRKPRFLCFSSDIPWLVACHSPELLSARCGYILLCKLTTGESMYGCIRVCGPKRHIRKCIKKQTRMNPALRNCQIRRGMWPGSWASCCCQPSRVASPPALDCPTCMPNLILYHVQACGDLLYICFSKDIVCHVLYYCLGLGSDINNMFSHNIPDDAAMRQPVLSYPLGYAASDITHGDAPRWPVHYQMPHLELAVVSLRSSYAAWR